MSYMLRPFLFFMLASLLSAAPVGSQELVSRVFNARDGLGNVTINDITFGGHGFVWLGTQQGLYRVSNTKVRRIDKMAQTGELFDSYINLVENIDNNHLLVSTQTQVYLYNIPSNSFIKFGLAVGTEVFEDDGVRATVKLENKQLLLLTYSGRVYELNAETLGLKLIHQDKLSAMQSWRYITKVDDKFLFSSAYAIEFRTFEGALLAELPWKESYGAIRGTFLDSRNRLWVLSSNGLFEYDMQVSRFVAQTHIRHNLSRMVEDSKGHLWIASRKGLILFKPETNELTIYEEDLKREAKIDYIHDMNIDQNGLIWVGGSGDGLALLAPETEFLIETYSKASKFALDSEMVWSIYSEGNNVWFGTDGSLVKVDETLQQASSITPKGIELNDSIYKLISLDQDHLLLGSSNGLFVVNKHTNASMTFSQWTGGQESLRGKTILSLELEKPSSGKIWIGTNRGLFYWQAGMLEPKLYPLDLGDNPPIKVVVFATLMDSLGRLWVSGNQIFGYLDNQGKYHSKLALFPNSNPSHIGQLLEVSPGIIWFASIQQGLFEYHSKTDAVHSLSDAWALDCGAILSLQHTQDANFIACSSILVKQNIATGKVTAFDENDGFISDEFNEGALFYRQDKGLYLGTPDGAMLLDVDRLENRFDDSQIFLESVSVYHDDVVKTYLLPEELKWVEPGASLLSFQITSSDYLDDSPLNLQYRLLEDADPDGHFLALDGQAQINVSGLSAGHYVLELQHKKNGLWTLVPYRFEFNVGQVWWHASWFKWLVIVVTLASLMSLLWYRQLQVYRFRKMNIALLESDDRLRQSLRGSDSDLWEWRSATKLLYLENKGGLLGKQIHVEYALTDLPIHEDDRERVRAEWEALLQDRGEMFESQYRYYREDGSWGWIRIRGRVIEHDPISGAIERVAGIYSDITLQKELESEINLLAQAFEHTTEGMLILDSEEKIIISNSAASLIFATKPEQLSGVRLTELISDNNAGVSVEALLARGTSWTGERELVRQDGEQCPAWMNISAMQSNKGLVKHYVVVFSDISERKQSESTLRYLANNDVLTGLTNRAMFTRRLTQITTVADFNSEKLALFFLDLDRFKHVDDSYGHSMGDALLVEAAKRLQSCLTEEHVLCRFGGDEFVILLRDVHDLDVINHMAERLLAEIERPFKLQGKEFFISTSIGISLWPDDSQQPETLIKNADLAMYHAKEEGRGNFQYYSAERNAEALYHLKLEADLRKAIERQEFILNYQPQVDILHQDRVVGVEALIRWEHPTDGFIRPDIFIKVAESCGLIIDIDNWVFRQACLDGARWYKEFNQSYKLSVNVSAVSFRQMDFIDGLKDILADTGMPAHLLTVEITEGVLMKELHIANAHLRKLKAMGIKVSIDDFGTGYSSLAYLRHFEVDCLKIDRSFLIDIGVNKADQAIVSSIVELARNLKLEVVAEGVETHEQLEQVFSRGCYLIQGYYFAKPMPRVELEKFLSLEPLDLE
ncbi:EAL domain-containing protein [Shewanella sp.]|uniref:EAL domain-containing protein n=1 Tax=Shewanella sp. TaxID=50422 RepID=UPI0040538ECB